MEAIGPCLSSSCRISLGVNVGYFLELKRTFQCKRVVRSASDEESVTASCDLAGDLPDLFD